MNTSAPRGIEHVGITVPDHDAATRFLAEAFGATILFSLVRPGQPPASADQLNRKNGLAAGTAIVAVSMLRLGNGANLEIFQIDRPTSTEPRGISDHGISHFSVTVDDRCRDRAVPGGWRHAAGRAVRVRDVRLADLPRRGRPRGTMVSREIAATAWGQSRR